MKTIYVVSAFSLTIQTEILGLLYVKARYSKHYRISEADLLWLAAHVEELGRAVHAICSERLDELEARIPAV